MGGDLALGLGGMKNRYTEILQAKFPQKFQFFHPKVLMTFF